MCKELLVLLVNKVVDPKSIIGKKWRAEEEERHKGSLTQKKGRSCPLGVKFSVHPSILLNNRECSPLGVNEGVKISPRGQISPLGVKFTAGVQG
jgi:hypothetical protein